MTVVDLRSFAAELEAQADLMVRTKHLSCICRFLLDPAGTPGEGLSSCPAKFSHQCAMPSGDLSHKEHLFITKSHALEHRGVLVDNF